MEAKVILLAPVLLAGCQSTGSVQQHAQSLSAAGQRETTKFTSQARWVDDGIFIAPNGDLWVSIGDEPEMGIPENDRICEQKQKYLRNRSYPHSATLRAGLYMYRITGQVKKHNTPMELALLPIVESAFDPYITFGANAAGIWQIIPSTGHNYGLKRTYNYDAHRDVVTSAATVLNMMRRLNKMLSGDWFLTVAAYNSGEGRAMKATKTNKTRGKSTDFWSLPSLQEARQYIPRILALSDILKSSKHYGVRLLTADESRALARVHLSSPVEMAKVVDIVGVSVSELKAFNAGVKDSILGVSGPQYMMVPKKHTGQLYESPVSGGTAVAQSTLVTDDTPPNSRVYIVHSGDILSSIVSRLGISTKDLQRWSKLRGSRLKPGQSLTINVDSNAQRLVNNSDSITYCVRKDDLLSSITKRHGVSIKDVMRWSGDTANLQPGDKLASFVKNNNMPDSRQTR